MAQHGHYAVATHRTGDVVVRGEDEKHISYLQISEVEPSVPKIWTSQETHLPFSRSSENLAFNARPQLLPEDAFDTHVHVFDPQLGPYSPMRAYTPGSADFSHLLSFICSISASSKPANCVMVQPSPYGTDNRVLLSILRQCQESGMFIRGIAVVDLNTVTNEELLDMHKLGIRGLRINLQANGHNVDLVSLKNTLEHAAQRIRHLPGWKLQMFVPAHVWKDLFSTLLDLPVVIIADHTGGLLAPSKMAGDQYQYPTQQPGFKALIELAKRSRVLIKVSGLYRSSTTAETNFADMAPLIRELATQVPDRLIWASDWPHTGEGQDRLKNKNLNEVEPYRTIDNVGILANIRKWMGSEETWMKVMVHNPRKAYE